MFHSSRRLLTTCAIGFSTIGLNAVVGSTLLRLPVATATDLDRVNFRSRLSGEVTERFSEEWRVAAAPSVTTPATSTPSTSAAPEPVASEPTASEPAPADRAASDKAASDRAPSSTPWETASTSQTAAPTQTQDWMWWLLMVVPVSVVGGTVWVLRRTHPLVPSAIVPPVRLDSSPSSDPVISAPSAPVLDASVPEGNRPAPEPTAEAAAAAEPTVIQLELLEPIASPAPSPAAAIAPSSSPFSDLSSDSPSERPLSASIEALVAEESVAEELVTPPAPQPASDLAPSDAASDVPLTATTRISKIDIVEVLIRELQSPNPTQRRKAIWELGQRGDSRAVQPLVDLLLDSNSTQRSLILAALSEVGMRTLKPLNRALMVSLQDDSADVRKNAIRDITRIYDSVAQISQIVQRATQDEDQEVRETAYWALGQLSRIRVTPEMMPTLPERIRSTSEEE